MRPILKVPIKYGLVGSVLAMILVIMLFYMDRHPMLIPPYIDFRLFLLPLLVIISLKDFRDYYNNGFLQFWQGMSIGFITYLVIGLLAGMAIWIFAALIEPDFLDQYIAISLQQMTDNKTEIIEAVGEEAYQDNLNKLPLTRPINLATDYFLKTIMIGILFTIIISVFLRRQPKT